MSEPIHIVIAGAGMSGLSAAVHLLRDGPDEIRVTLVDPRNEYGRDRTWCSWLLEEHPFVECISHRWQRWTVTNNDGPVTSSADVPYVHIPSDRFYPLALKTIEDDPRAELLLGVAVRNIVETTDGVALHTDHQNIDGDLALDSRPPARHSLPTDVDDDLVLLQHFGGLEVETSSPVFDEQTVTLMDFAVPQRFDDGIHFLYVLPYSRTRALVESTWFGGSPSPFQDYRDAVEAYLAERYDLRSAEDYEVRLTESGVIPMTTANYEARPSSRVHRIGLAGGHAKPSTGYAFVASQTFAAAFARALHETRMPQAIQVRSTRSELMDHVFLQHLAMHPWDGPEIFKKLFEKIPGDRLVRFLSDAGTVADDLRVMGACSGQSTGLIASVAQSSRRLGSRLIGSMADRFRG